MVVVEGMKCPSFHTFLDCSEYLDSAKHFARTHLASNRDSESSIAAGGAGKHTADHLNSKQVCMTLPTWFPNVS